jgi:hypothetical protein
MAESELPIFNDNLKSSASWTDLLARAERSWKAALAAKDTRTQIEHRLREIQVEQILLLARHEIHEIDEQRLSEAARIVSLWAGETEAKLSVERLLELQRVLIGAQCEEEILRKTEPLPINAMHDPTPARLLPRMLDNAFDWFATPAFGELRAVEQATVVYLRLLDLHPFPVNTAISALLAASFYTERAGLPPLIIFADEANLGRYNVVVEAAFRMLTQPFVEFFAEMLRRAMSLSSGGEDEA